MWPKNESVKHVSQTNATFKKNLISSMPNHYKIIDVSVQDAVTPVC